MYEIPRPVVRILAALAGTALLVPALIVSLDSPDKLGVIAGNAVTVVSIARWRRARWEVVPTAAFAGGLAGTVLFAMSPWGSLPPGIVIFAGLFSLPSTLLWWALWGGRRDEPRVECPACSEDMVDTGRREYDRFLKMNLRIMHCPKCGNEAGSEIPGSGETPFGAAPRSRRA